MKSKKPMSGGRWTRDPKSGTVTKEVPAKEATARVSSEATAKSTAKVEADQPDTKKEA